MHFLTAIVSAVLIFSSFSGVLQEVEAANIPVASSDSGCALPPIPRHGMYVVPNYNKTIEPGAFVETFTIITYYCIGKRFHLSTSKNYSVCEENNEWSAQPKCYKSCTLLSSYTVDYACFSPEVESIPCRRNMLYGASVQFACKKGHMLSPTQRLGSMKCRNDGRWDIPLPDCVPDCGRELSDVTPLIVRTAEARRDTVPWNVAVYQKVDDKFDQICGGTIISTHIIISAAHCFSDNNGKAYSTELYRVVANKHYRSWGHQDDSANQTSEILRIGIHDRYDGNNLGYASDLALLFLKTPLEFSENVMAICLDLNNEIFNTHQLTPPSMGKVAGWGLTETRKSSEVLRVLSLPVIADDECRREFTKHRIHSHFTYDKFCGGYQNGTAVCNGDSGAGLVFRSGDSVKRWYLRGVVSVSAMLRDTDFNCREDTYTAFTKIYMLKDWILSEIHANSLQRKVYQEPVLRLSPKEFPRSGCPLPVLPHHGQYSVSERNKAIIPGERVPAGTVLTYSCHQHFVISEKNSVCGQDDKWSKSPVCSSSNCTMVDTGLAGVCRPLANCRTAMEVGIRGLIPQKCNDELVCCAQPACPPLPEGVVSQPISGSRAADYCIELAEQVYPCQRTSTGWTRGDTCPAIPDPSIEYHQTKLNTTTEAPYFGWLGTGEEGRITWKTTAVILLSDRWLVTSARAIEVFGSGNIKYVGLGGRFNRGRFNRGRFNRGRFNRYSPDVIYKVSKIIIHPEYNPTTSGVYNDIALVEVDRRITFTSRILPACLHTGTPLPYSGLILTGWHSTLKAHVKTSMKLVPQEECAGIFTYKGLHPDGVRHHIEICSRPVGASGPCRAFGTGSPLSLYNGPRVACTHLLVGIASAYDKTTCTSVFTRVSGFIPWIESIVWT